MAPNDVAGTRCRTVSKLTEKNVVKRIHMKLLEWWQAVSFIFMPYGEHECSDFLRKSRTGKMDVHTVLASQENRTDKTVLQVQRTAWCWLQLHKPGKIRSVISHHWCTVDASVCRAMCSISSKSSWHQATIEVRPTNSSQLLLGYLSQSSAESATHHVYEDEILNESEAEEEPQLQL